MKWSKNKEISYVVWFLLDQDNIQILNKKQILASMCTNEEPLPFINLHLHCVLSFRYCCTDGGRFLSNSGVSRSSSFFISVFALYYLIRVWLSFRTSSQSPWEEVIGDLEYQCSFLCWYLFLFAFLIICIEAFGFS